MFIFLLTAELTPGITDVGEKDYFCHDLKNQYFYRYFNFYSYLNIPKCFHVFYVLRLFVYRHLLRVCSMLGSVLYTDDALVSKASLGSCILMVERQTANN